MDHFTELQWMFCFLQLPRTVNGNQYVIVFMDYLTKWPEAFAAADQTAETIACLFVEQIVCLAWHSPGVVVGQRSEFLI